MPAAFHAKAIVNVSGLFRRSECDETVLFELSGTESAKRRRASEATL